MSQGEWVEQPLTAEQRERNQLWLATKAPERAWAGCRDQWGPGPSHTAPVFGDQWFDRATGRCWVWTDLRPRCPFCHRRFEPIEVEWLEFTPPHLSRNRLLAAQDVRCCGAGQPLER